MLETICKEISITPELFAQAYDRGLRTPAHKRIFEQIMACDNYLSFKKLMLKRNRELEEEAVKMLQQEETNVSYAKEMQEASQRKQQAELELAMALSLTSESEKQRMRMSEEEELQQAIKLSELEYQEFLARQKQQQLEEERKSLEQKRLEMQSSMQALDENKRREIEEAKRREAGLTREQILAQERARAALQKTEEEARRVEEEKAAIEQLRIRMEEQKRLLDETQKREIEAARRKAEQEAISQVEAARLLESQKSVEQRKREEEAKVKMIEEMRRTEQENRWQTSVLEATKRGLKPGDVGYPVRSLPGFGLLPGQPGYPLRPGEEGYGVVAGLPIIAEEEVRWREAVAAAEAAGLKPGKPGYPIRNLPAFGLQPGQPGYPYREGEVGYGIIAGVSGFTDEARRWQAAVQAAERAGLRAGQRGYPVRDQPAFGLEPTDAAYPYRPGEPGYGVPHWSAAEEEKRWQEAVQAAERSGLKPGNPGYPVRDLPAFGLTPGQAGYPVRTGEPGYGGLVLPLPIPDEERRWNEAVRAAEAAGIRPGQSGYPIRSMPAFGLQVGQPGYPYRQGEPGFGVMAGQPVNFNEQQRWQEAVQAAEAAGLRPGQPGYPVRNLPAFGLKPNQPGYPIKPGESGYGLSCENGEVQVPGLNLTPQQKAAMQEAQAKARTSPPKPKKPEPRQPTEEEKRQKELEEKKVEELRRLKEREAEEEVRRTREQEWKRQQEEASQRSREKAALPPVQLKKPAAIGEIPLSELQKGKVDISSEQEEAENLRRKAEDILRANETTELETGDRGGMESLAKRQERLRRQRDLLLAKKKAERERELKEYLDQGGNPIQPEGAVQGEELEKRKHIASKIKQSLLSS